MCTSWCQVSDLENFEFCWEDPDLSMDTVLRLGIDFFHLFFNFEMRSMTGNPILIGSEQDNENFPPHPSTPISEQPNEPRMFPRSRPFEMGLGKDPRAFYLLVTGFFIAVFVIF